MTPPRASSDYTELALVEQPAVALLSELGWKTADLYNEILGPDGTEGRESEHQVILTRRLRSALERLNPGLSADAYAQAIEELARDRSTQLPANANRDFYRLVRNRVKVRVPDEDGHQQTIEITVIDWENPANNEFFLASQMWVS